MKRTLALLFAATLILPTAAFAEIITDPVTGQSFSIGANGSYEPYTGVIAPVVQTTTVAVPVQTEFSIKSLSNSELKKFLREVQRELRIREDDEEADSDDDNDSEEADDSSSDDEDEEASIYIDADSDDVRVNGHRPESRESYDPNATYTFKFKVEAEGRDVYIPIFRDGDDAIAIEYKVSNSYSDKHSSSLSANTKRVCEDHADECSIDEQYYLVPEGTTKDFVFDIVLMTKQKGGFTVSMNGVRFNDEPSSNGLRTERVSGVESIEYFIAGTEDED